MRYIRHSIVLCFVLLTACNTGGSRNPSNPLRITPDGPYAAVIRFPCPTPVYTTVHISDGHRAWALQFDENQDPAAGLKITGLTPGYTYTIRVTTRDADGSEERLGVSSLSMPSSEHGP